MLNIVLFGAPGAGKGTQSEKLVEYFHLVHISTGDLLRKEISQGTQLGMKAKSLIDDGQLVPDNVVIGMIENQLRLHKEEKGFIFDGFPRTVAQAEALDELLKSLDTEVSGMVALTVPKEELVKRLTLRGQTSGRTDDTDEEVIEKRIKEYNNKTKPVADYYQEQNKFYEIDGTGEIDEIFNRVKNQVEKL